VSGTVPASTTGPVSTSTARPGSAAGQSDRPNAWDDGEGRWNLYFAVVLVATLVVVQAAGGASEPQRLIATGALVAMVPWYYLVGRPAMYSRYDGQHPAWYGALYLIGLVPLLAAAEYCAGIDTFILLALCPQAFMAVSSYRISIGAVVALNAIEVAVALVRGFTAGEILSTAGIAVLGITFSVAFGTWIVSIINQSAERAELIAQLEQTRAELAEVNREAGVLAERDRLASEIHDTIAQGFTSIVMLVQAAEAMLESGELAAADRAAPVRRQLALIDRTARENLTEARTLVAGLAPAALTSATLADALARLTDRVGQELDLDAKFSVAGAPMGLGTSKEVVLLRVCQEALANVRKHAKASSVRVRLDFTGPGASLEVADDGSGFDPALTTPGYGSRGMRARVAEIGGKLDVRSAPGEGTVVRAEVR
jgi:signal transduction histidine kinase